MDMIDPHKAIESGAEASGANAVDPSEYGIRIASIMEWLNVANREINATTNPDFTRLEPFVRAVRRAVGLENGNGKHVPDSLIEIRARLTSSQGGFARRLLRVATPQLSRAQLKEVDRQVPFLAAEARLLQPAKSHG